MQIKDFPTNYKDLPIMHMHGSARFRTPEGVPVLFGLIVFLYFTHILNIGFESGPTQYVTLRTLAEAYHNWRNTNEAFFVLAIIPWASAWIGLLTYLFSPTVTYRTGLVWSSLGFCVLFFINMFDADGRALTVTFLGLSWEYRVLQLLFISILLLCMHHRAKLKKQSPDENQ